MNEDVIYALNSMKGEETVYIALVDHEPAHPFLQPGSEIRIVYGSKPERLTKIPLGVSSNKGREILEQIVRGACITCKEVFIEDLHQVLLRIGSKTLKIPDIRDGGACVFDVSFGCIWIGLEEEASTWDIAMKLGGGKNIIAGAQKIFSQVSRRGKWYYFSCYIPIVEEYIQREQMPVYVWDDESKKFLKRWIHYDFNCQKGGRLNVKGTVTGKEMCFNPHFVKKTERHKVIRARPGYKILMVDCKSAEIAMGACLSGDEVISQILKDGGDPYSALGEDVPGGPFDRDGLKHIMIAGFAYGSSVSKLSEDLNWDPDLVRDLLKIAEKKYSKFFNWAHQFVGLAKDNKSIVTPTGRYLPIPEDRARVLAVNYLFQSTNADVNTATYAALSKSCREDRPHIVPLIHIHDGYVLEVPSETAEEDRDFVVEQVSRIPLRIKELEHLTIRVKAELDDYWRA